VGRGPFTLIANFSRAAVHVPRPRPEEVVLSTHQPTTVEPGHLVLPPLSGAVVR
jgi:hypothetical protein